MIRPVKDRELTISRYTYFTDGRAEGRISRITELQTPSYGRWHCWSWPAAIPHKHRRIETQWLISGARLVPLIRTSLPFGKMPILTYPSTSKPKRNTQIYVRPLSQPFEFVETPGASHCGAPAAWIGLVSGEVAGDTGAVEDVAVSRGGNHGLVECLRKGYEVTMRGYRRQDNLERIYGDDILVTRNRSRGFGFGSEKIVSFRLKYLKWG